MAAVVASVALTAACRGGADERPSDISEEDLPQMVLQREDVPSEFRRLPSAEFGIDQDDRAGALAGLLAEFEVPPRQATPGETACISSEVTAYDTPNQARDAVRGVEDYADRFTEGPGEFETEVADVPTVGNQAAGVKLFRPGALFCSYANEDTEAYLVTFRLGNVTGSVTVYAYGRGASLDEAIDLAQKQATRIEATFERGNND